MKQIDQTLYNYLNSYIEDIHHYINSYPNEKLSREINNFRTLKTEQNYIYKVFNYNKLFKLLNFYSNDKTTEEDILNVFLFNIDKIDLYLDKENKINGDDDLIKILFEDTSIIKVLEELIKNFFNTFLKQEKLEKLELNNFLRFIDIKFQANINQIQYGQEICISSKGIYSGKVLGNFLGKKQKNLLFMVVFMINQQLKIKLIHYLD